MTDQVQAKANRFPMELAAGIEGLDNEKKRAIFVLLYDSPGLSFTEIQNELSGDEIFASQQLSDALKDLQEGGLIDKQVRGVDDDSRFTSAYSVSNFGEMFFRSLLGALGSGDGSRQIGGLQDLGDPGEEIRMSAVSV